MQRIIILTLFISNISAIFQFDYSTKQNDYGKMIEDYLETKTIEPTVVFLNDGRNEFNLLEYKFSWKQLTKGIEIIINNDTISTVDKKTSNPVWGTKTDNVGFANYLQQVNIYSFDSLIGFVLIYTPCSGLACGVNYQIIYDLKTKKSTFFGRFRTGFEFNLYNFNNDEQPDYLSKTFYGRNIQGIDTTEYVLFSRTENGDFEEYKTDEKNKFWFRYIYSDFIQNKNDEKFEENWIEKINSDEK